MSRYEGESRTWGTAAREISKRIRAMPEFTEARELVIAAAVAECHGCDVPAMRALGGFTAVITRHIAALPERFRAPVGSKLLPATVASELRASELIESVRDLLRLSSCSACGGTCADHDSAEEA